MAQRRVSPAVDRTDVADDMLGTRALLLSLFELFRRDWANIDRGLYTLSPDMFLRPDRVLATSRRIFEISPLADQRRQARDGGKLMRTRQDETQTQHLARYYVQNFHYQVEALFSSGADAMLRPRRWSILVAAPAVCSASRLPRIHASI